jgi:hypothetical protein
MEEVLRRLIVKHSEDAQRLLKVVTTAGHPVPWAVAQHAAELARGRARHWTTFAWTNSSAAAARRIARKSR